MWDVIEQLKRQVDALRPLNPELMRTIAQKFREDWTYHSNAIEGNTFTYQETAFFLREGLTVKGKSLREHLEIVNHAEAVDYLADAMRERELTERFVKDLHAMLFQGVRDLSFAPGAYKQKDNHVLTVSGELHRYCSYLLVPQEMEALIGWYDQERTRLHSIELAALFHHKLAAIHPFSDGNGRVSRLCMNFILMKNGFPPAIIRNENRLDYYVALEQADQHNADPFIRLVADEVERSLNLMADQLST